MSCQLGTGLDHGSGEARPSARSDPGGRVAMPKANHALAARALPGRYSDKAAFGCVGLRRNGAVSGRFRSRRERLAHNPGRRAATPQSPRSPHTDDVSDPGPGQPLGQRAAGAAAGLGGAAADSDYSPQRGALGAPAFHDANRRNGRLRPRSRRHFPPLSIGWLPRDSAFARGWHFDPLDISDSPDRGARLGGTYPSRQLTQNPAGGTAAVDARWTSPYIPRHFLHLPQGISHRTGSPWRRSFPSL